MKYLAFDSLIQNTHKKIIYYLEYYKPENVLFIFDHGLGDMVEFLDIYNTIKIKYPKWKFNIGIHPTLDYLNLHKDIIQIKDLNINYVIPIGRSVVQDDRSIHLKYDIKKLSKKYKLIFCIQFKDFRHPLLSKPEERINGSKNETCLELEFGLPSNTPLINYTYSHFELNNKNSNQVIYHMGGHTDKGIKLPPPEMQALIWKEIVDAGFKPMDVHINTSSTIIGSNIPLPPYISEENSIRNKPMSNQLLIDEVLKSKYCIGVLSGPLHVCTRLLGHENCAGVQGVYEIKNYVNTPEPLTIFDIKTYTPGKVYKWLKDKQ